MSRLLTCGWETGLITEAGANTIGSGGSLVAATATPTPRSGNYCLKLAPTSATVLATYTTLVLPAAKTDVWLRFGLFVHNVSSSAEWQILMVLDPTSAAHLTLRWDPTTGQLRLYRGTTLLATGSTPMTADAWHLVELRTQMTSTTVGVSELWLDGAQGFSFSGDNSNTTTASVGSFGFGLVATAASMTGSYLAFDDVAINDTVGPPNNGRPGDGSVVLLVPNGAGSSTQFTRGGTDTGANWSQVSEVPPSITEYVASATVGNRDLYAMSNLAVSASSIAVVEAIAFGQNSDAGGGSLGMTVKSGATTNEATAVALPAAGAAGLVRGRWETDPNTSSAWTGTAVNALEAGITVR